MWRYLKIIALPLAMLLFVDINCIPSNATAQRKDAYIHIGSINFKLLEHLLKKEIDSVRNSKGLGILMNNDILYQAAADHASFLATHKELTHFQGGKKKTPQNRVEFYGSKYFLARENVLSVPVHIPIRDNYKPKPVAQVFSFYQQMAHEMMLMWVHSKKHYANLVSKNASHTGVAIAFNKKKSMFYAVEVIAVTPLKFIPVKDLSLFPYAKLKPSELLQKEQPIEILPSPYAGKWDLVPMKSYNKIYKHQEMASSIQYMNSMILMPYKVAKKMLKGKNSGMIFESISLETYHSDCLLLQPARRNGGSFFNGVPNKPRYSKTLMEEGKVNSAYVYRRILGIKTSLKRRIEFRIYTDKIDPNKSLNLILFKNNQVFQALELHSITPQLFNFPKPEMPFVDELKYIDFPPKNLEEVINDTLDFTIYFKRNEHEVEEKSLKPIISLFNTTGLTIKKAIINAYSSVEGTEKINNELYVKRAQHFIEAMEPYMESSFKEDLTSEENWELFKDQLAKSNFAFLLKKDKKEIRAYVNANVNNAEISAMLNQQRYAHVTLITKQTNIDHSQQNPDELIKTLIDWFNYNVEHKDDGKKVKIKTLKDLIAIQNSLYSGYRNGKVSDAQIDKLNTYLLSNDPLREISRAAQIRFNEIMFNRLYRKPFTPDTLYFTQLQELGYTKIIGANFEKIVLPSKSYKKATFNNQAFMINNIVKYEELIGSDEFLKFAKLSNAKSEASRQQAEKQHYFNTVYQFLDPQTLGKITALDRIPELLKSAKKQKTVRSKRDSLNAYYHLNRIEELYKASVLALNSTTMESVNEVYKYFVKGKSLSEDERIKYAVYFFAFKTDKWINELLEPIIFNKSPNHKALALYIKYKALMALEPEALFELYENARKILSKKEWCDIFNGQDHVHAHILEQGKLRNMYCTTCVNKK